MNTVDHRLCEIALDYCDTTAFERFSQAFYASVTGLDFVPLGGMHDGGADGFQETLFEAKQRPDHFFQASKSASIESKVRHTIKRLIDYGRDVKRIAFFFFESVSNIDQIEQKVENEFGIIVRIRSKQYIVSQINGSDRIKQAFNSYLRPSVTFLNDIGTSGKTRSYPFDARTLCAFLGQEVERRLGNASLLESVTDTMVLWALEGTDPDKKIMMTRSEILGKIEAAVPSAKQIIRGVFDHRIELLAAKNNPSGREISWHKKEDKFALRYEERQKLVDENIGDELLKSRISDSFRQRIAHASAISPNEREVQDIVAICHRVIERMYEEQGLAISVFAQQGDEDTLSAIPVRSYIEECVAGSDIRRDNQIDAIELVSSVIRGMLYAGTSDEREYLQKLSRTYFLLFLLKNEPKVVEYFNSMASQMVLYIGSDLLIMALSEHYLPEDAQTTTNALRVIRDFGARLIMTEPVLNEIDGHIAAADLEFRNHYSEVEPLVNFALASKIDRILIRAYFYARLGLNTGRKPPAGWKAFINQFCSYEGLQNKGSRDGLRAYLVDKFRLDYETESEVRHGIDPDVLERLRAAIVAERRGWGKEREDLLALNDALQVLRVFTKRAELAETTVPNPFGYRTWWLTHERAVRRAALKVHGVPRTPFIMRPEFLLNYIALSPCARSVSQSYKRVFPSVLGVRLGQRISERLLHDTLAKAKEAYSVDPSRARAIVGELIDKLKTDQFRMYEEQWDVVH